MQALVLALMFSAMGSAAQQYGAEEYELRARPVSEIEAVDEFERTCLRGLSSLESLRRALKDSGWNYRSKPDTMNGLRSNWVSSHGELNYIRELPAQSALPLPQCNLTTVTRQAVREDILNAAIQERLTRLHGEGVIRKSKGTSVSWTWRTAKGPISLYRLHAEEGGQQIILSLQSGPGFNSPSK
jgi:hypothetical protein